MKHAGFTLVEVLVALVLVALGAGAVMSALSTGARAISRLEERSLAEWVALNVLSETRLNTQSLSVGERSGEQMMAGRSWRWRQTIAETAIPEVLQITVRVEPASQAGKSSTLKVEVTGARLAEPLRADSSDGLWDSGPARAGNDPATPTGGS
jgi:general secretion pathway protein I